MKQEQSANDIQHEPQRLADRESFVPCLRAFLTAMPEVRVAYYQPVPGEDQLCLSGPDHARVVVHFSRSVSREHVGKRLSKIRRHFSSIVAEEVEFHDIERLDYRDACEVAFNALPVYGAMESIERDRLYRYNVFLEWNAGRKVSGVKQELPPVMVPSLDRPVRLLDIERFVTPIYRQLKMIDGYLRELRRLTGEGVNAFSSENTVKSLAESYMLKGIQSTIIITMSVMHRTMRLAARDYRDLFLLMPVYGMTVRERAAKLARCAEIRDRLMFLYEEVLPVEVYEQALEVTETLQDFRSFMLEWIFEHYYGATGELIQSE